MDNIRSALIQALGKLLKPLCRLLLRNGIAYAEFADFAKQAYVEVANEDFVVPGRKQSLSRIAVLTGIHRHEVGKILKREVTKETHIKRHTRAARVITGWQTDANFSTDGVPHVLSIDNDFTALVAAHGGDVTVRAVLDELERVGTVRRLENDRVELVVVGFNPQDSIEDLLYILGDCTTDLLETLEHNLTCEDGQRRLQMSVVYNNLPDDVLRNLELVCRDRGLNFLKDINQFFATQDRDSNPGVQGEGRNRAGLGLYYFQKPNDTGE